MNARFMVMCFTVVLAASAYGQTSFVPIGELKVKGVMGGVENGRWIAPARAAKLMNERTEFVLIGKRGVEEGGVTFGRLSQPEDPCDDFYPLELELKMDLGVAIGSVAKWNPMPRMPKEISLENKTYRNIVAGYLRGKGIANPVVRLTRAFRIDLDGDGTEEVLISATHFKYGVEPRAARGDYSFVMLRTARRDPGVSHCMRRMTANSRTPADSSIRRQSKCPAAFGPRGILLWDRFFDQ